MKICLSELKIRPPIRPNKDWCLVVKKEVDHVRPLPFFSARTSWFLAGWEADLDSSYLQVALTEGLAELYYGGVKIRDVAHFKLVSKQVCPFKYVMVRHEAGWAGLLYKPSIWAPNLEKNVVAGNDLREFRGLEGYLYKRWTKFVPQVLMGALKKYYGHRLIDYVAYKVNKYVRQVHSTAAAHVHDGAVYFTGQRPARGYMREKTEMVNGWSFMGLIRPGDPPRYWGVVFNNVNDMLEFNELLRKGPPQAVVKQYEEQILFPQIVKAAYDPASAPMVGLPPIEAVLNFFEADSILVDEFAPPATP